MLALALAAGCAAPSAKRPLEPQHPRVDLTTPLPPVFDIEIERPDLPAAVGGLTGIWKGDWQAGESGGGSPAVPHTLVVKRIVGQGPAFGAPVIWSVGGVPGGPIPGETGFVEVDGEISADAALRVAVPGRGRAVYRLAPDGVRLSGELDVAGRVLRGIFRRYPEWGVPPGPGPGSPRSEAPTVLTRPWSLSAAAS